MTGCGLECMNGIAPITSIKMAKITDTLFIIPARGGSKGIPHKNIKLLAGRPLIDYTIEVARQLADDDRVILSTDDPAIADVARRCGLPVDYMRPAEFATDICGSREVMLDAMEWADSKGIKYDKVCLLQPTSPMRTADDVMACIERYTPDLDMVVSTVEASSNPYYNCFEVNADGFLDISKGNGGYVRRQDAPPAWEYSGAVYVINPSSLRRMPMGDFKRRVGVAMDREKALDLDTPLDWAVAETILSMKNN